VITMNKGLFLVIASLAVGASILISIYLSLQTTRNDVSLEIENSGTTRPLIIAVVGDLHLAEDLQSLTELESLLSRIKEEDPDLIVLVGDYIKDPTGIVDINTHRNNVIKRIGLISQIPHALVLGNYESWSNPAEWSRSFSNSGLNILENEVDLIRTKSGYVCVRGFGDAYTGRFRYLDFPDQCEGIPKLSITHDPAGALQERVKGLVIAGHTHCGQISIPIIGPLWVPSDAPRESHCGTLKENDRTVFTTSGVGTSILPIRFGTQSEWDLIEVQYSTNSGTTM
jgi:predicted MPP superfamily phosphohydrolase